MSWKTSTFSSHQSLAEGFSACGSIYLFTPRTMSARVTVAFSSSFIFSICWELVWVGQRPLPGVCCDTEGTWCTSGCTHLSLGVPPASLASPRLFSNPASMSPKGLEAGLSLHACTGLPVVSPLLWASTHHTAFASPVCLGRLLSSLSLHVHVCRGVLHAVCSVEIHAF